MRILLTLLSVLSFWTLPLQGQMTMGGDTIYGNEWIKYDQRYFKLKIAEEAIFKISVAELSLAGFPVEETEGRFLQLFSRGVQIPIYVNNEGLLSDSDYLLFYGVPNRSELDSFLYANGEADMLNPGYSLINDTASYFLTWNESPGLRYELLQNDLQNLPDPELYFMDEILYRETSSYIKRPNGAGSLSRFSAGEGFAGAAVVNAQILLPAPFIYSQGPAAQLEIRLCSNNSRDHELQLLFNEKELESLTFNNFNFISRKYDLPAAELLAQNKFNFNRLGVAENRYSLGIAALRFPSLFQLSNGTFKSWKPNRSGKQQIVWTGLSAVNQDAWLLDPQANRAIRAESAAGTVTFGYAPSDIATLVLGLSQGFKSVSQILPLTFENYTENIGNYLMLSQEALINGGAGSGQVQAYADYRRSSDGGSYDVTVADVQQIYDQFGWGVDRHFIAVRNFFHYLHKTGAPVEHILLLGKGRDFRNLRTGAQVAEAASSFFVPTFGGPGADMLLVCNDQSVYPLFSLGRIPAVNGDDIRVYLDKVIEYENAQRYPIAESDRFWQKRVLHLSGGTSAAEREQLRGIMSRVGKKLEDGLLQSQLFSYAKLSSDPVEGNVPDQIYDLISSGVSLISFLGHSGSSTIDFAVENFNRYNNKGKYSIFLALGCSVGNVHVPGRSYGENFVFQKDKASVAFLASSGLGYPSILENYTNGLYLKMASGASLSIGEIFRETHRDFSTTGNRLFQEQLEQMTTNGDPAIKFNYPEGPDFKFDIGSARLPNGNVNINQDSFLLEVDILNLGLKAEDSISLEVTRIFPGGEQETFIQKFLQTSFRQKIFLKIPVGSEAVGQNSILLHINPTREISERPETDAYENNKYINLVGHEGFNFYLYGQSAVPLWPPDLALIKNQMPELKSFTGDLFAPVESFLLEIDETPYFNSAWKLSKKIQSSGGVLKYTPEKTLSDNTTYFWRISSDSISPDAGFNWQNMSFSVSSQEGEGLSMRHPHQFKPIENFTLKQDSILGWVFGQTARTLEIKNQLYSNNNNPFGAIEGFTYSGMFPWYVLHEGVLVQVINPYTGLHWRNPPGGKYGSINTHPTFNIESFPFNVNEQTQREALISFINDTIPEGFIVFVYSILRTANSTISPDLWAQDSIDFNGKNLYNILESQGVTGIRILEERGSIPFIAGFIKGKNLVEENYGESKTDTVDLIYSYLQRLVDGSITWEIAPIFSNVDSAKWKVIPSEFPLRDTSKVKLDIIFKDGSPQFSETSTNEYVKSISIQNESMPAEIDFIWDPNNPDRYASQLKDLTINGSFLPDLVLYPTESHTKIDTIQQGENYSFSIIIENTFNQASGATTLNYRVRSLEELVFEGSLAIDSLGAFGQKTYIINIPTQTFSGLSKIDLALNEQRVLSEIRFDNNFGTFSLFVETDKKNPLIEVYFDGIQIMDGDLVSAKPEIRLILVDENQYFPLNDTSLFEMRLLLPSQTWDTLSFNSSEVLFLPANGNDNKNKAEVIIRREMLQDGEYLLEIKARDVNGNSSGSQPYRKRFQIINQQMISSLVNYPNPFSTQTRFLYTLTGADSPEFFKIQIYTVGGQLVREIDHMEIGPLKVGTHLTDYVWDGKDAYGNQLANGVYIYRMHTKNNAREDVEHYETRSDEFSTNGWSKMVILR